MKLLLFIPIVVALVALFIWLIQIVWNAVMPDVFSGLHTITFWQAFLLSLLSGMLIRAGTYSGK
jgi:Ca2+/H+ antiporter, TMEM165/GDT1 family